jgi:hypothetical protein
MFSVWMPSRQARNSWNGSKTENQMKNIEIAKETKKNNQNVSKTINGKRSI